MADSKVSALTAATSLGGSDLLYLVQSNTSKKITVANFFNNAGNLTLSGNINIGGTPQALGSPGIISLTTPITHLSVDATGGVVSLPQGTNGQVKIITLVSSAGGVYTINPVTLASSANLQFNSVGDTAICLYTQNKWHVIGRFDANALSTVNYINGLTGNVTITTANVNESGNLYFTNTRAINALTGGSGVTIAANGLITSTVSGAVTSINGLTGTVVLNTANVNESGNLYFTNARVYSNVTELGYITNTSLSGYATNSQLGLYSTNAQLADYATISSLNVYATNVQLSSYATNAQLGLYATNTQLDSYATVANLVLKANISDLTTSNVTEGTNLYFSNTRAKDALVGQNILAGNVEIFGNLEFDNGATIYGDPNTSNSLILGVTDYPVTTVGPAFFNKYASFKGIFEQFTTLANSNSVVTHNCENGHIFYHNTPTNNWTVNLTNLNLLSSYASAITLVINQGATPYYANALQINGSTQTIKWQGNTLPTPNANAVEIQTFSILLAGASHVVLGQLTSFG